MKREDIQLQEALEHLRRNFGSTKYKPKKPFTKEIRERIAEKLINNLSKQKEVWKKVGL